MVPRSVKQGTAFVVFKGLDLGDYGEIRGEVSFAFPNLSFVIDRSMTQREVIEGIGFSEFVRLSKLIERG